MVPPSFRDDNYGAAKSEMSYPPSMAPGRSGVAGSSRKLQSPESKRIVTQWMKTSDSVSGKEQNNPCG